MTAATLALPAAQSRLLLAVKLPTSAVEALSWGLIAVRHLNAAAGRYSPLWCTAGGAAGAAVGDGVTKVSIWGVWPAAKAPGPDGVKPSSALQARTSGTQRATCLVVHV